MRLWAARSARSDVEAASSSSLPAFRSKPGSASQRARLRGLRNVWSSPYRQTLGLTCKPALGAAVAGRWEA